MSASAGAGLRRGEEAGDVVGAGPPRCPTIYCWIILAGRQGLAGQLSCVSQQKMPLPCMRRLIVVGETFSSLNEDE